MPGPSWHGLPSHVGPTGDVLKGRFLEVSIPLVIPLLDEGGFPVQVFQRHHCGLRKRQRMDDSFGFLRFDFGRFKGF